MGRESTAAHSLRRATTALDGAAACLIAMQNGALDRGAERLEEAAAALSALVAAGIPAQQKSAMVAPARALQQRVRAVKALVGGLDRFFGKRTNPEFGGYTAEGEAESLPPAGQLLFEL